MAAGAHFVNTGAEKFVQHIVLVGGDHQMVDGQTHHAGHVTGANIAKVATGHGETDAFLVGLGHLKISREVINHLGQQTRPVDGIDRADFVAALEIQVVRDRFDHVLAIVKHAFHGDVENIRVLQAEHLCLLEFAHAPVRAGHEHANAFFAAHRIFGGAAGVARGGAQDVQLCRAAVQFIFKQVAQQLHGHVFESQRGAVGQFQNKEVFFKRPHWRNQGGAKNICAVGLFAKRRQIICRDVVNVQTQNFKCQVRIALGFENLTQSQ